MTLTWRGSHLYREFNCVNLKIIANASTAAKNNRTGSFSYVTQTCMILLHTHNHYITANSFIRTPMAGEQWLGSLYLKWLCVKGNFFIPTASTLLNVNSVCLQVQGSCDKRPPADLAAVQPDMWVHRAF